MSDSLLALAERIGDAPFAPETWPGVLSDLAAEAGGWGGQLIAASDGEVRFFLAGGVDAAVVEEFAARGGGDPAVNPRVAAVLRAEPMRVISDAESVGEADRQRSSFYRDFLEPADSHFVSMAPLELSPDLIVVTAVNHSRAQGAADADKRARYEALLPHLKAAARLQMKLEDESAAIALGALDRLSIAAIVCDFFGRVVAASARAEAMLSEGALITQGAGRLRAASAHNDRALASALEQAGGFESLFHPRSASVLLRRADGAPAAVADVAPLPSTRNSLRLRTRILVTIGGAARTRPASFLLELGLTEAEAEVARALVDGASTREIAERRKVKLETVRTQIKSIHAKLDVRRQSELLTRLRDLI